MKDRRTNDERPVHQQCKTAAPTKQDQCTNDATPVHQQCNTRAPTMQDQCLISAEPAYKCTKIYTFMMQNRRTKDDQPAHEPSKTSARMTPASRIDSVLQTSKKRQRSAFRLICRARPIARLRRFQHCKNTAFYPISRHFRNE
jgi:hypothetical protein